MPLYKKIKGEGNFASYFDNDDVIYIEMPNFGYDIGQEELKLWGKIYYFFTAKQNCLKADRLEINIWVHKLVCLIIFYPDWCFKFFCTQKQNLHYLSYCIGDI